MIQTQAQLKYAVFVFNEGDWERRTALKDDPNDLSFFMQNHLHGIADKEILRGPEQIIREMFIPQALLQDMIYRGVVEIVKHTFRQVPPSSDKKPRRPYFVQ
jgi:hypothetical protein